MRVGSWVLAIALALIAGTASAQQGPLVPERRLALTENTDLAGGDIQSIFDTTLETCQASCLAEPSCTALTFNSRANACFLKDGTGTAAPYQGALSGRVLSGAAGAPALAATRAAETAFLQPADFDAAYQQASGLGREHVVNDASADQLAASAGALAAQGDFLGASRMAGAAVVLSDAPELWLDYSTALLSIPTDDYALRQSYVWRAVSASLNAYLRAENPNLRASILAQMALSLQAAERGRDMIPALKLAQDIAPRDDNAALLDDAIAKYGFNISENVVESDLASPRICANFNAPLITSGVDYAPFVALPDGGLAVDANEYRICVTGVEHGKRYVLTFREGLPSATGETLARDVTIQTYVRDRAAAVRFPGRAYILPRATETGVPVETVNTAHLDLTLLRISDRNLVRAFAEDYVGRPMDYWTAEYFTEQMAEKVWTGVADVAAAEPNRDVTTNLPLAAVLKDLGPGIYALKAEVPDANPDLVPPATQWFAVSDLGLTTMQGTDGLHVFVRGLADAGPKPGATVTLVSRANAVIGTATTDAQGYARFAAAEVAGTGGSAPALVTVAEGEDFSFLSLIGPEFDLSDRGVEGRPAAPAIDVFLATDRGAYRAGETVNATLLARDPEMKAIEGLPLTARLIRPDGIEYARQLAPDAGGGGRAVSFALAESVPRGAWRFEILGDENELPLASEAFLVEDFLPERIDFTLAAPEGGLTLGQTAAIDISARYLFGAPGADLPIEGDFRLTAADGLAAWPGYRFGRYDRYFPSYYDTFYDAGRTDAEGDAVIEAALPELGPEAVRPLTALFAVRLSEGSGRPVERTLERTVMPASPVIGIKPAFADGVAPEKSDAAFELVAVGPDGKATGLDVHWKLNRLETRYQWYALYGQWNWDVTTLRTTVAEGDARLSGAPLRVTAPVDWGNYEIVVESTGDAVSEAALDFYAGWYVPVDAAATPDTLELALDKAAYRPGETARVRIVPRAAGVALVTVLSNHLIDMKAVPVTEGENTIELPVTDAWGAGAYVTASVLRPLDAAAARTPARALGLSYATVDPGPRKLDVTVEAPTSADPRGPLPVAVRVDGIADGQKGWVTLAAVDEGILNLTGYQAPDPDGHYFGQRRLGMAIRDIYGRLIDSGNGTPGAVRSGGDGGIARLKAPPPTEELVAYFTGPIEVGADGLARASFDLPAFNGSVKLMAVAWTATAVGQAQAAVLVRDPVVVTASVPRFLAPGDQATLRLEVVHATGPAGRMGLDVTADGLTLGAAPSGVDLAEGGKATLSVPVSAGDGEADATIRIALTTPDGRQLVKNLNLPVRAYDPEVMRQSQFPLAAGKAFTLGSDVFAGFVPGTGHATLALGPIGRFNAPGILASLDRYPYGCTEQLASKAMPLIYFGDIAQAMGVEGAGDIHARVEQAIAEVLLNQSSNGAFGLWYPDYGDMWLDAFVTDFLSRARGEGYEVPETAFRNALDNLRNQINYQSDFDSDGGPVAYALMVLAREGAASMGDLRYYADVKSAAFDTPVAAAQLGAALAYYGDQRRADAMFRQAADQVTAGLMNGALPPEAQVWRADYGTNLRDAAAVLALGAEAGSAAVPVEAIGSAVAAGIAERTLSTQEATWALLATHALMDGRGGEGFTLNGQPVAGPVVSVDAASTAGGAELVLANGGQSEATLTLTTFGVPEQPPAAGGNGYRISRSWYTLDGAEVDPSQVSQGSRLVAVIEVTPLGAGEARLIVDDPLPAGFEIDNPNLIRAGDVAALGWLETFDSPRRTEFRQDRFLAALDWASTEPFRLAYIVRAISPGSYHLPAATVADMYRPDFRGWTDAGRVTVTD